MVLTTSVVTSKEAQVADQRKEMALPQIVVVPQGPGAALGRARGAVLLAEGGPELTDGHAPALSETGFLVFVLNRADLLAHVRAQGVQLLDADIGLHHGDLAPGRTSVGPLADLNLPAENSEGAASDSVTAFFKKEVGASLGEIAIGSTDGQRLE
jgi:hypothetical protein